MFNLWKLETAVTEKSENERKQRPRWKGNKGSGGNEDLKLVDWSWRRQYSPNGLSKRGPLKDENVDQQLLPRKQRQRRPQGLVFNNWNSFQGEYFRGPAAKKTLDGLEGGFLTCYSAMWRDCRSIFILKWNMFSNIYKYRLSCLVIYILLLRGLQMKLYPPPWNWRISHGNN